MTIPFKNIPSTIRTPLFFAEVDPSFANTSLTNQRALIIGQITADGIAPAGVPLLSMGVDDAKRQGGQGSMLALMTEWYRKRDTFGEVWYLPLADAGSSVAANGSINFTHAATATGVLSLYIAGVAVPVTVTSSQVAADIATAVVAAINANADLPVTAEVNGTTTTQVDITAKNAGLAGNDIDLRLNYRGTAGGEAVPAGLTYTLTAMGSGATNPTLTAALANLADQSFDFIVCPYTDATSLDALKAFLDDVSGRWSYAQQVYGHVFAAFDGTVSARATFGTGRNDQHATVGGLYNSPTPSWLKAANIAGTAAVSLRADPGIPLQTLATDILAPPLADRDTLTERNTLLYDGISTFTVAQDGTVQIENMITTYQKNGFGAPDNSYLEIETMFLLMFVLRFLRTRVTSKFARVKLAADGTRLLPGSGVVTPNIIKADQIAAYRELEAQGMVQNSAAFASSIVVELDANNPNRVNVLWPGTLIDQLRIFALLAQFRLS